MGMNHHRMRRRPMSEINVVPYIDVMLVLLVIFMITAPLLKQGVEVSLPQASAKVLPNDKRPLVVTVDSAGNYYLNILDHPRQPISAQDMVTRVAAVLKYRPGTPVLIKGDEKVDYGKVVAAMVLLQRAGAPNVGLVTEPPSSPNG